MAFTLKYQILFTVEIRHGYFLNKGDRESDFALSNNPAYRLQDWLQIMPTKETASWMKGHKARMILTASGIKVLIEVVEKGGKWEPHIPFESTDRLQFTLQPRIPVWSNLTNVPLHPSMPAVFYFSNATPSAGLAFPYLSQPIAAHQSTHSYEMGELVHLQDRILFARQQLDGGQPPVAGGNANWQLWLTKSNTQPILVASVADQMLLPRQFNYRFKVGSGTEVKKGSATLKKLDQTQVQEVAFDEPQSISSLACDFSEQAEGFYELEVNSDQGYNENRRVYLSDTLHSPGLFGLLDIELKNTGDFRIIENTGSVRQTSNIDATPAPPSFQLLIPNRFTFWRYHLGPDAPTLSSSADVELVNGQGASIWISKEPLPLSWATTRIEIKADSDLNDDMIDAVYLPNPSAAAIQEKEGRYYSDLFLSKIKI